MGEGDQSQREYLKHNKMSTLSIAAICCLVSFVAGAAACYFDFKKPIDEFLKRK